MIKQRKIELLAPAKNLECGIEAINHGADAVYIGAPKFGARASAETVTTSLLIEIPVLSYVSIFHEQSAFSITLLCWS